MTEILHHNSGLTYRQRLCLMCVHRIYLCLFYIMCLYINRKLRMVKWLSVVSIDRDSTQFGLFRLYIVYTYVSYVHIVYTVCHHCGEVNRTFAPKMCVTRVTIIYKRNLTEYEILLGVYCMFGLSFNFNSVVDSLAFSLPGLQSNATHMVWAPERWQMLLHTMLSGCTRRKAVH